jgi:hypothetical protein
MTYEVLAELLMVGALAYVSWQIYQLSQKPINVKVESTTIKNIDIEHVQ